MNHGLTSPLVGRDAEVAALLDAAVEARAGDTRCVVVTGEAGIGKTRLVSESLARTDALVVTGHAADLSTGELPFGVLAATLRDLLYRLGPEALLPAERAALAPLLPGDAQPAGAEPGRILAAALDLLTRLSAERLLVWVVEDHHWADAATRDLVSLTARTVRGRLLVVVTVRTGDPVSSVAAEAVVAEHVASLTRIPQARRLDLSRLADDQVRTLLASVAGDLPLDAVRTITRLSEGVPFLAEELAAAHGRLEPMTMAAALTGRVGRLSAAARRVVEATAIGGAHLHISLVERVLEGDPPSLDDALAEAVAAGVLVSDSSRDQLGFRHELLRETVAAGLGPGARRGWHRRWAEALEADPGPVAADPATLAIAEHWHQAGDVTRSVAAAYAATPAAHRTCDETHHLALWHRILVGWERRDPRDAVGRLTVREAIGEALKGSGVGAENDQVMGEFLAAARALPMEPPEGALLDFVEAMRPAPKSGPEDVGAAQRAAAACDWTTEPPDALTRSALTFIGGILPASESARADSLLGRAQELAETVGDDEELLSVVRTRALRLIDVGEVSASIRMMEAALAEPSPGVSTQRLTLAGNLAYAYVLAGRHDAADALLSRHLETTPHLETMPSQWEHLVENAVATWLCTGDWTRARRLVAQAAPWWGDDLRLSSLWDSRVELLQRGETDERRWLTRVDAPIPDGPGEDDLRHLLALAAGMRGDLATMRELAAALWQGDLGIPTELRWQAVVDLARVEADAATAQAARPDRASAESHLDLLVGTLATVPHPGPHDAAASAELVAQLDRFHGRDARSALEVALTAWADLGHVPDVAVTHLSLAEANAAVGDRDAAREHLVEGHRIAEELGAGPWVERAAEIARRYGFTTRERRTDGLLTSREAEVLALLAEGRTNKEIASTLVISPKTASVHVSRVIAKLGAHNRTEAVGVARRQGLMGAHEG